MRSSTKKPQSIHFKPFMMNFTVQNTLHEKLKQLVYEKNGSRRHKKRQKKQERPIKSQKQINKNCQKMPITSKAGNMFGVVQHQKVLTVRAMYNTFTKNIISTFPELHGNSQNKVRVFKQMNYKKVTCSSFLQIKKEVSLSHMLAFTQGMITSSMLLPKKKASLSLHLITELMPTHLFQPNESFP